MKRALLVSVIACALAGQAHAGLFTDEETRKQIKELEGRISLLEDASKQRSQAMMDLQAQLDALNDAVRKLQGQNEELQHDLQDAEKRQKDFYIDLDTRLRRIESGGAASGVSATSPAGMTGAAAAGASVPIDPVAENRDFDAAFALFKANKLQPSIKAFMDFLNKYPGSTLAPNAYYRMGVAYYGLKDYPNAVNSYLTAASKFPASATAPNAMLGAAICYQEMGDVAKAKRTLSDLIAKYPNNPITPRAKKRLESLK
jgi:tol-pal system protein YbgF